MLAPGWTAAVTLGLFHASGAVETLEATGLSAPNPLDLSGRYLHTDATRSLGWWTDFDPQSNPSPTPTPITPTSPQYQNWQQSPAGKRWAAFGVNAILCSLHTLSLIHISEPTRPY